MVKFKDFSRPLSVFQVLFKANLIFQGVFKTVLLFKFFSSLCEVCEPLVKIVGVCFIALHAG